jgi:hypothetical protein
MVASTDVACSITQTDFLRVVYQNYVGAVVPEGINNKAFEGPNI